MRARRLYVTFTSKPLSIAIAQNLIAVEAIIEPDETLLEELINTAAGKLENEDETYPIAN